MASFRRHFVYFLQTHAIRVIGHSAWPIRENAFNTYLLRQYIKQRQHVARHLNKQPLLLPNQNGHNHAQSLPAISPRSTLKVKTFFNLAVIQHHAHRDISLLSTHVLMPTAAV